MAVRDDEIAGLDATAQAALISKGEVSSLELVDVAIARIEQANPATNAIVSKTYDDARQWAQSPKLPKGPFRGVPFAFKDLGAHQKGMPYCLGNKALKAIDHRASNDSVLGTRFRKAGLITLGVTHAPELGNESSTVPEAHGTCRNPWNLKYSALGSSAGSAAAVACGMLPLAHGNDGGGSIRMPASWCGVVGLKPSRGRLPATPGHLINRRAVEFALTRSMRDTATLLDAVNGATNADLFQLPLPKRPFVEALKAPTAGLRIGVMTQGPGGITVHPECQRGLQRTVTCLTELGHHVEENWPDALTKAREGVYQTVGSAFIRLDLKHIEDLLGRPLTQDDVGSYNWHCAGFDSPTATGLDLFLALESDQQWSTEILQWWQQDYDVLLTPTVAIPPWKNTDLRQVANTDYASIDADNLLVGAFTSPFNVTGQPAISLPLHWTEDGLPVGMQLVADMGREDILIQLGAQLEQAMPWCDRKPLL